MPGTRNTIRFAEEVTVFTITDQQIPPPASPRSATVQVGPIRDRSHPFTPSVCLRLTGSLRLTKSRLEQSEFFAISSKHVLLIPTSTGPASFIGRHTANHQLRKSQQAMHDEWVKALAHALRLAAKENEDKLVCCESHGIAFVVEAPVGRSLGPWSEWRWMLWRAFAGALVRAACG